MSDIDMSCEVEGCNVEFYSDCLECKRAFCESHLKHELHTRDVVTNTPPTTQPALTQPEPSKKRKTTSKGGGNKRYDKDAWDGWKFILWNNRTDKLHSQSESVFDQHRRSEPEYHPDVVYKAQCMLCEKLNVTTVS